MSDGAIVAISLAVLSYAVGSIWWAATMTSIVRGLVTAVQQMASDIRALNTHGYTKAEAEKDLKIVHDRIDRLSDRISAIEQDVAGRLQRG